MPRLLRFLGALCLIIAACSAIYSVFILRPRLNSLTNEIAQSISTLDHATQKLEQSPGVLIDSLRGLRGANQLLGLLPDTLTTLRGTLNEAAIALSASSATAKKVKGGITGLILPKGELGLDHDVLVKAAEQMRLLAFMVGQLDARSQNLSGVAKRFDAQLSSFQNGRGAMMDSVHQSHRKLQEIYGALSRAALPIQATLLGLALGGLYLFFGFFAFALAAILENTASAARAEKIESTPKGSALRSAA